MRIIPFRFRQGIGAFSAMLLVACGSSEPTIPASIAIATSSSAMTVAQGASSTVTVTLTRTNFTDDVQLTAEGIPSGVTATFAPATLSGSATQSTLTLAAGAAAVPGAATFTVRARGTGVADVVSSMSLSVPQPPSYTMTLASTSGTLVQNASSTVNVALARTNFTGAVTFAATGVPAGTTVSFAPNPSTTDATVMTINAGTAAPGVYTITVTGTASGLPDRTASFALTVTPAPAYTMTPAVPTISITAGASATVDLALARTNFTGNITLAVSGLPTGASATFSPNPATGSSSTLTINTGTAAAGSYALTITGTAASLADRTAPLTLTITAVAGTNVQFAFCGNELPIWVGYQDGTGAWRQASLGANNTYSFTISGKGGVAVVRAPTGYATNVYYASAAELQAIGAADCTAPQPGTKTVYGSVSGAGTDLGSIVLGSEGASTAGNGPFTLHDVPDGTHDLLATLWSMPAGWRVPSKMIIRRGLNPASGSTLPVLDFGSSEAVALSPSTLLLPGVDASTSVLISSNFSTANGSSMPIDYVIGPASAAAYTGIPGTIAGDLQEMVLEAMETTGSRGAWSYFTGTGTRTFTLGPTLNAFTITSLGVTPYPRMRTQFASQSQYDVFVDVTYSQASYPSAPTDRGVMITATRAYFGGAPGTWDLSVPDMSAAAGFMNSWMLAPGTATHVFTAGYGGDVLSATPAAGTTIYFAATSSDVTSPSSSSATRLQRLAPSARSAAVQATRSNPLLRFLRNRSLVRGR